MKKPDIVITPKGQEETWQHKCSWCDADAKYKVYNTKAEHMDYACEKHYQQHFRKTPITCPDCGSTDIEVIDGPVFAFEGAENINHSGSCNACFCAWTID